MRAVLKLNLNIITVHSKRMWKKMVIKRGFKVLVKYNNNNKTIQ